MKIGVDMGGTNIRVGVVRKHDIIKKCERRTLGNREMQEILDDLIAAIYDVISPEVKSIGIGVPSVVDTQNGVVYNVTNISSWKTVRLKDILEDEFNIPVTVNNDANCFTLGEQKYGVAKGHDNVVGITIGTGLGAGLIVNGQLYSGSNTCAGEIGDFLYLDKNMEYYCSGQFFSHVYGVEGVDVAKQAELGSVHALKLFASFGKNLGHLIKTVLFAYDPQVIVLGGSISKSYEFFSDEMLKVIRTFPYPTVVENIKIKVSNDTEISILGAAELNL